jgi:monoamine oxidase
VNLPGGVLMSPEPAAIANARRLAMGNVVRFTMKFRERWWESLDAAKNMSFLFTPQRDVPVWWTTLQERTNLLTGWVGGPRASSLLGKSADELGALAVASLAEVFGLRTEEVRAKLIATFTCDWSADAFARGAYSYVPSGALDAPAAMTRPEADTIFFAGEHTDLTANWGTVHAAIRSGLRAAQQVLGERGL